MIIIGRTRQSNILPLLTVEPGVSIHKLCFSFRSILGQTFMGLVGCSFGLTILHLQSALEGGAQLSGVFYRGRIFYCLVLPAAIIFFFSA